MSLLANLTTNSWQNFKKIIKFFFSLSHLHSFGKKRHPKHWEWRLRGQAQPTQGGACRQRNQSPQVVSSVGGSCITKRYSLFVVLFWLPSLQCTILDLHFFSIIWMHSVWVSLRSSRFLIKVKYVCLFCIVWMYAFPKEGSGYPIWDFAPWPGTEQTFLLP